MVVSVLSRIGHLYECSAEALGNHHPLGGAHLVGDIGRRVR